jgi:hypothetical protein
MDIQSKTCVIGTWGKKKKHVFLDISSTNTDTFVPYFYQCVETGSTDVFRLLFHPLPFQPLRRQRNICHQG